MKIHQLLHETVDKFAPMDERTKAELAGKASDEYGKVLYSAEQKEKENLIRKEFNQNLKDGESPQPLVPLTFGERSIKFLDSWYMQYALGVLFIILIPVIRNFINGDNSKDEPDNEQDMFQEFLRFKRFNNGG